MRVRAWKWIFGIVAVLLLAIPGGYTWFVYARASGEIWAWSHQLAATFFSVGFAFVVTGWLYTWQTERSRFDRRNELRATLFAAIFDAWDLLDDRHLQSVQLPNGSEAQVLLTFLQPGIYEDAFKSGLFSADEAISLARLAAIINLYNNTVQRIFPVIRSLEKEDNTGEDGKRAKEIQAEIDAVLENREQIIEAGKNLVNRWTLKEVRRAMDVARPGEREKPDPRVEQIIEGRIPDITSPSFKAGIHEKTQHAQEALKAGDLEASREYLDEAIKEAQNMRGDEISENDADELIAQLGEAKRAAENEN